jgi:5S rRNA maturation endonuclease (ribonuclease M5)
LHGIDGPTGNEDIRCPLPGHDDQNASFGVLSDGQAFKCLGCNAGGDAIELHRLLSKRQSPMDAALDLAAKLRIPLVCGTATKQKGMIVATYEYRHADGRPNFEVCRLEPKSFRQRHTDETGKVVWTAKGLPPTLYRAEVIATTTGTIYIVEGERDVHSMELIGLAATCNAGGAGKWKPEHSEFLRGRDVVVICDNDQPGLDHGQLVCKSLKGIAASVKIIYHLPTGKDATEFIEERRKTGAKEKAIRDEILAMAAKVAPFTAETETKEKSTTGRYTFMSGETITATELPECRWFVDKILPEGFALLVGRSKAGKSYLALQVLAGIASGEPVLGGLATTRAGVAYLSLEDSIRQVKGRYLDKLRIPIPGDMLMAFDLPTADRGAAIEALDELLAERTDIRVVCIDTVGMIRPPAKRGGATLYDDDVAFYSRFRDLAHKHHALILGLHHTNKLQKVGDIFDTVSGSMGTQGAADTIMILEEPPGQDGFDRILHVRGKDVDRQSIALRAVENYHWVVSGDARELRQTAERQTVLDLLRASAEPQTPADIAKVLGKRPQTVSNLLSKMSRDRLVVSPSYGKWTFNPYHHPTP